MNDCRMIAGIVMLANSLAYNPIPSDATNTQAFIDQLSASYNKSDHTSVDTSLFQNNEFTNIGLRNLLYGIAWDLSCVKYGESHVSTAIISIYIAAMFIEKKDPNGVYTDSIIDLSTSAFRTLFGISDDNSPKTDLITDGKMATRLCAPACAIFNNLAGHFLFMAPQMPMPDKNVEAAEKCLHLALKFIGGRKAHFMPHYREKIKRNQDTIDYYACGAQMNLSLVSRTDWLIMPNYIELPVLYH